MWLWRQYKGRMLFTQDLGRHRENHELFFLDQCLIPRAPAASMLLWRVRAVKKMKECKVR